MTTFLPTSERVRPGGTVPAESVVMSRGIIPVPALGGQADGAIFPSRCERIEPGVGGELRMAISPSMIVSTTFDVQGRRVREYRGVVRGITVRAPTISQGILGGLKSIIGGQIGAYTEMCEQARQAAYDLMVEHARRVGANAILGGSFDPSEGASPASAPRGGCYGTAGRLQGANRRNPRPAPDSPAGPRGGA